jgi:adenylate kinase
VKRRIVLLGPPASGKGTLADRLESEFGLPTVSPGSLLRQEKAEGTELGWEAHRQTQQGMLVDDDTINAIVGKWLDRQTGDAFVFDGYPRTLGQATALEAMLAKRGTPLDLVILLEADPDTLRDRVAKRATCSRCGNIVRIGVHVASLEAPCPRCGGELVRRSDDTDEALARRLQEYAEKTEPLINYYEGRNVLRRVDTQPAPDQVFEQVRPLL